MCDGEAVGYIWGLEGAQDLLPSSFLHSSPPVPIVLEVQMPKNIFINFKTQSIWKTFKYLLWSALCKCYGSKYDDASEKDLKCNSITCSRKFNVVYTTYHKNRNESK